MITNAEGKEDSPWKQQAPFSLLGISFQEGVSMQLCSLFSTLATTHIII
jgi:hypothetical protein